MLFKKYYIFEGEKNYLYGRCPASRIQASLALLISLIILAEGAGSSGIGFIPIKYNLPDGKRCLVNL